MTETIVTTDAVRLLLLAAQGLTHPPAHPASKPDVLKVIRHMGALQIDTIHVIARSPYMVLFSRLGDYQPAWLDELLAERALFEYWSHAACFLPVEDYPLYVSRMQTYIERYYTAEWSAAHHETITRVMNVVQAEGEVRSADFERTDGRKGSWWDWKVEKRVLEYLFTLGDLMIARREKFQRVYDLRERVQPGWEVSRAVPLEEAQDELAVRSVRSMGAAPARWVADYFRLPKSGMTGRLERLVNANLLCRVAVEGWQDPWYIAPEHLPLLERAATGYLEPTYTTLLSPFDPLIWDRERARTLFHFDFSLECYLPAPKRRYGYYLLPILHRGQLIGRLDAKAHRRLGIFEVRALYLEPGVSADKELAQEVRGAIQRCAEWHGTPKVEILRSEPESFAGLVL